jgi:tetratricopeptide (TPR) repeat protein
MVPVPGNVGYYLPEEKASPMNRSLAIVLLLPALMLASPASPAQTPPSPNAAPANAEVQAGIEAYSHAAYDEAIAHFEKANELQPGVPQNLLLLGSAYAAQVVPGLKSPDNLATANKAIAAFQQVLRLAPNDGFALRELAGVYVDVQDWGNVKQIERKILAIQPADFEAEYQIGAVDWFQAIAFAHQRLLPGHVDMRRLDYPAAPPALCASIAAHNRPLLQDALQHLQKAVAMNPQWADALAYLNLVMRVRAGTQCANRQARQTDLAAADRYKEQAEALRNAPEKPCPQPPSKLDLPPAMQDMLGLAVLPPPPPPPPPPPGYHAPDS